MSRKLALSLLALSFALVILLAVLFAFPLRHVFMNSVVTPLITSFLVFRWYLHRISQLVLWVGLVLAGGILMLWILFRTFPLPRSEKRRKYVAVPAGETDLRRLAAMISRARRHPFARRRIASELVPLTVRLIAQRERISLPEARDRFESFAWCDDEAVPAFFDFRRRYYGAGLGKAFEKRLHEITAFLERYHQGV